MRHLSPARAAFALVVLSTLPACSKKDPLYCDGNTPCSDPERPFCDDDGAFPASDGIKHTCIPYPWDAGPNADAGPSCTPGEWTLDTIVADGNVGYSSAIVVDSRGLVHVVYTDDDANEVRYAYGRLGNWTLEETTEEGGYYLQMAIDSSDTLHVTYPGTPSGVRYLTRTTTATQFDGDLAAAEAANDVGMALDSQGHPIACYYGMTGAAECVAWGPDEWTALPLPPVGGGSGAAVAIGDDDVVHLTVDGIDYATFANGEWTPVETASADADIYAVIQVDEANEPHVAFREASTGDMRHAYRVGADDWMRETIDASVDTKVPAALVVLPDAMHAVYAEGSTSNLKYAVKRGGGEWTPRTVNATSTIPSRPSLFVNAQGGVHVAYGDTSDRDLMYAYLCP